MRQDEAPAPTGGCRFAASPSDSRRWQPVTVELWRTGVLALMHKATATFGFRPPHPPTSLNPSSQRTTPSKCPRSCPWVACLEAEMRQDEAPAAAASASVAGCHRRPPTRPTRRSSTCPSAAAHAAAVRLGRCAWAALRVRVVAVHRDLRPTGPPFRPTACQRVRGHAGDSSPLAPRLWTQPMPWSSDRQTPMCHPHPLAVLCCTLSVG